MELTHTIANCPKLFLHLNTVKVVPTVKEQITVAFSAHYVLPDCEIARHNKWGVIAHSVVTARLGQGDDKMSHILQ